MVKDLHDINERYDEKNEKKYDKNYWDNTIISINFYP